MTPTIETRQKPEGTEAKFRADGRDFIAEHRVDGSTYFWEYDTHCHNKTRQLLCIYSGTGYEPARFLQDISDFCETWIK